MNNDNRTINYSLNYRSSDSVLFWFAIFLGSFSLHLLAFLVLLSSAQFKSFNPQSSQNIIAIDIIDIPPIPKTEVKQNPKPTLKPKLTANLDANKSESKTSLPRQKTDKKSVINVRQKPVKTAYFPAKNPENNLSNQTNKNPTQKILVNHQNIKPKPQILPPIKPEIKINSKHTPIPKETNSLEDIPWNHRQEVELGKETPLPNNIYPVSPIPKSENSPIPKSENSQVPKQENSPIPKQENSSIPKPETSSTSKGIGIRVNITPILKDEIQQLREDKKLKVDALPDVIAEYKGSLTKELELNISVNDSGLKPANVLASLVIDKNGNFQQGIVINIQPDILNSEKNRYEQVLNKIFDQESFVSAYNLNGTKPELSNLYLRIRIEVINNS